VGGREAYYDDIAVKFVAAMRDKRLDWTYFN
jgi:hypothetical protein